MPVSWIIVLKPMSEQRSITPSPQVKSIVCSEFRKGRNYSVWRPRGSGDWLLIYTLAGGGCVTAGGGRQCLSAGDVVLFAPGAKQDYSTAHDAASWHLQWVHFRPRPHWRPWLLWPEIAPLTGRVALRGMEAREVGAGFQRMLVAHRLGGDCGDDLAMNALEEILIRCARANPGSVSPAKDERVRRALQYLAAHPDEPFLMSRLAAHCRVSGSRLSHLFKEETGTTPQRFSEKLRLDFARQLLAQTNLSIAEVGNEVGFDDPLYFSRRYRRAFGCAPYLDRSAAEV